jgi:uncharacterized protein (TIGR00645 family)
VAGFTALFALAGSLDSRLDKIFMPLLPSHQESRMTLPSSPTSNALTPLSGLIFSSRWLQLPLYLGLIVAQGVYVVVFVKELWHLIHGAFALNEQEVMLIVLGLIDVVMISNLLLMVIVGGYETFVSRLGLENHPDQPEWLSHVNASVLKVKLAMAIIGISSIHLLKTFIEAGALGALPLCADAAEGARCATVTATGVMWQTIIHMAFIVSAIGISWTDRLMQMTAAAGRNGQPA